MRTIVKLGLVLCSFAVLSYGDSWSGKLLDAACLERNKEDPDRNSTKTGNPPTCVASQSTGAFALQTPDAKVYKLVPGGISKAATALRGNPDSDSPQADVSGAMEGQ